METLITYKTRNGASKKYADWLADRYKTEAKEFEAVEDKDIKKAKKIYIVSGTYGGIMPLTDFARSKWNLIKNKDISLVAVGMSPENSWWSRLSFFMIPGSIKKRVKYYKLPGQMPDAPDTEKNVKKENLNRVK